ncbi:hypothetical protein V8B55DRAFT_1591725 [Mucor lusitanicus]
MSKHSIKAYEKSVNKGSSSSSRITIGTQVNINIGSVKAHKFVNYAATTASTVVADASSAADTTAGSANAGSSTATFTAATTDEFSLVQPITKYTTTAQHTMIINQVKFSNFRPHMSEIAYKWFHEIAASPPEDWIAALTLCSKYVAQATSIRRDSVY